MMSDVLATVAFPYKTIDSLNFCDPRVPLACRYGTWHFYLAQKRTEVSVVSYTPATSCTASRGSVGSGSHSGPRKRGRGLGKRPAGVS